jgi:hypothetical protein
MLFKGPARQRFVSADKRRPERGNRNTAARCGRIGSDGEEAAFKSLTLRWAMTLLGMRLFLRTTKPRLREFNSLSLGTRSSGRGGLSPPIPSAFNSIRRRTIWAIFMRTRAKPKAGAVVADQPHGKLVRIGAKVVSHGRYVTVQLAEVAVPRQMFAEILSLIARPQAPPAPA